MCGAGAQDDIVLQTFKQQQEAYRQLLEGMKVGAGSMSPSVGHALQCDMRSKILQRSPPAVQKIPVPLNGDDVAVSKYATEIESLKKKVRARGCPPAGVPAT